MESLFKIRKHKEKQIFESQRNMFQTILQLENEIKTEGILHTIYGNHCFIFKYRNTYFTSKKIDDNNYIIHFPLGIPLVKGSVAMVMCLDAKYDKKTIFDVHLEPCSMKDLIQHYDFFHLFTNDGTYLKFSF